MALSREEATASAGDPKKTRTTAGRATESRATSRKPQAARPRCETVSSGKSTAGDAVSGNHQMHPAIFATPRCVQCSRELPGVPFALDNILCRECYGLERYPEFSELRKPEKLSAPGSDESIADGAAADKKGARKS